MDPEAIEKKLKELNQTISEEQEKGKRIIALINKSQEQLQLNMQGILEMRGKANAYQEILNG